MNYQTISIAVSICALLVTIAGAVIVLIRQLDGVKSSNDANHREALLKLDQSENNIKNMNVFIQSQINTLTDVVTEIKREQKKQGEKLIELEKDIIKVKA